MEAPSPIPRTRLGRMVARLALHPRLPLILGGLACIIVLPSLGAGLAADDWFQRARLVDSPNFREIHAPFWDMFLFKDGNPEHMKESIDRGHEVWWTLPELKIAFCRPIAAFTHWIDYRLWPDHPPIMHAQNIMWFFFLVVAVTMLYRRLMGVTVLAGLAALLFALEDAHGITVGWLASRNALLACLFGTLTLLAHDRWRRDGWRLGRFLAPVLLLLSLLSAEAGVATMAYLVPYALFLDKDERTARFKSLLPYCVLVIVWRIVWTQLGYGMYGHDEYVDPGGDPWGYLGAVGTAAPYLMLGQWAFPPSDLYCLYDLIAPGLKYIVWCFGVVVMAVTGWALWPLVRHDSLARFWAFGMVGSLLPICSMVGTPMDRLLIFVGLGALGLLAQILSRAFAAGQSSVPRGQIKYLRGLAYFFVAIHIVVAPVFLAFRSWIPAGSDAMASEFLIPDDVLGANVASQDVIVVNAPHFGGVTALQFIRDLEGKAVPRSTRVLGPSLAAMHVSRPSDRELVIRPEGGYVHCVWDRAVRGRSFPMPLGHRVDLTGLTIEITELRSDGRPAEARFTFDRPLEDESLCWLYWHSGRFRPFDLPPVGGEVFLPVTLPSFALRDG